MPKMQNPRRLHKEVKFLKEGGYNIKCDLNSGEVYLFNFEFPTGWEPKYGRLFYDIPPNYPRSIPTVYFSEGMEFRGDGKTHMHLPTTMKGYDKFCLREEKVKWEPDNGHSLVTLTEIVVLGLNNPNNPNKLLREADIYD